MRIRLLLFARAKDILGTDQIAIELSAPATVSDLRQQLRKSYPQLATLLPRSALAVDEEFADDTVALGPDAVVALIPPVSGG